MTFNGWVAIPRTVLEHTSTGGMTPLEFAAWTTLTLLADSKTGSGTINANTLPTFLSGITRKSARDVLLSLQKKGFIWREIVPHSKRAYRYWVHGYECSQGRNKGCMTDCSQVFETNDSKGIRYVKGGLDTLHDKGHDTGHETLHETLLDTGHSNNKDKNKDKKKDTDNVLITINKTELSERLSLRHEEMHLLRQEMKHEQCPTHDRADAFGEACNDASGDALPEALPDAVPTSVPSCVRRIIPMPTLEECGIQTSDGLYYDAQTGEQVSKPDVVMRQVSLKGQWRRENRYVDVA